MTQLERVALIIIICSRRPAQKGLSSSESPGGGDAGGIVRLRDVKLCIALKTEKQESGVEEAGKPSGS